MVNILKYVVPFFLLLYLIFQARKGFAGAVALFLFPAFGANAYLNFADFGLPIKEIDIVFASILVMWAVARKIRPVSVVKLKINLGFILAVFVVLIFLVHLFIGIYVGLPRSIIPMAFRMEAYFGIGFFLWIDVFSRFRKDEIWNFLYILLVPTVFLSIPYILSALGVSVYPYQPYRAINYLGDQEIIRDFITAPKFLFLAVTVILLRRNMSTQALGILSVLVITLFFTYTRVYIIQFVFILLLSILWHLFRNRQRWVLAVQYFFFLLVSVFTTTVFDLWKSTRFAYFSSRFQELFTLGTRAQNFEFRIDLVSKAYQDLSYKGLLLWGNGMHDYGQIDLGSFQTVGDSWLGFALFFFGLLPTVLYCIQMLFAGGEAFRIMRDINIDRSRLGAYLFILMMTYIIAVFNVSYVFDGALGAILISLVYVERLRQRREHIEEARIS